MSTVNPNIFWVMILLLFAIVFLYLIHWIVKKALFRKVTVETFGQTAYGLHLALSFSIAGLLLSKLPELLEVGMYVAQSNPLKLATSEGSRLISIFFGLSFVFFLVIYLLAYSVVKLLHPKTTLKGEVSVNNIGYVLQHGAVMLLLLLIVQHNFVALCKDFLPQSNIPFYR